MDIDNPNFPHEREYVAILAREFRKARGIDPNTRLQVSFPEGSERIIILEGCNIWIMEIGSDDDGFWFRDLQNKLITFPMPDDWLKLEEQP
jgi:hypothetical protein